MKLQKITPEEMEPGKQYLVYCVEFGDWDLLELENGKYVFCGDFEDEEAFEFSPGDSLFRLPSMEY